MHCHSQYLRKYLAYELPLAFYLLLVRTVKEGKGILKGGNWNGRDLEEVKGLYSRGSLLYLYTCILHRNENCDNGRNRHQSHKKMRTKRLMNFNKFLVNLCFSCLMWLFQGPAKFLLSSDY